MSASCVVGLAKATCFEMTSNASTGRYLLFKMVEKQIEKFRNFFRKLPPWWSSKSLHRLNVAHREGEKQHRVEDTAALKEPICDEKTSDRADAVCFIRTIGATDHGCCMLHDMTTIEWVDRQQIEQRPPNTDQNVELKRR